MDAKVFLSFPRLFFQTIHARKKYVYENQNDLNSVNPHLIFSFDIFLSIFYMGEK